MGVDSGLGTFRGRNAGVWPPLKALKVDFSEMSCPEWFETDPRLGWAFWHFRHQAYTKGSPHAGYDILAKWGGRMPSGFFSVTSNIDGHWERTEGVGPDKVHECHGAVTHMQCVNDDGTIWKTDDMQMEAMELPVWDLRPGEAVEVGFHKECVDWQQAIIGEDGATVVSADGNEIAVKALRRPGGIDLMRVTEMSPLPVKPETGQPARPNVLMFGDYGVNCDRIHEQEQRFKKWKNSLAREVPLAILEVGAGKAVPTIRNCAQRMAKEFPNSTLVRINWDDSDVPDNLAGRSLSIGGIGALDALSQIDSLVDKLRG